MYLKWRQDGITVAGGHGEGYELDKFFSSWSMFVDDDEIIYVADWINNRIVEWKTGAIIGHLVAGGNGRGNRDDQLNLPINVITDKKNDCLIISDRGNKRVVQWPHRNGTSGETIIENIDCFGLSMDNDGYLYVADETNHEVKRWKIGDTNGIVVAGGNGKGDRLNQLNAPRYIFVDQDHSVYVSDFTNHRVMKWIKDAKEGIVVAGGHGYGNDLTQFTNPYGISVDQFGTVYVIDYGNNRVMAWLKGAKQGCLIVAGNGAGTQSNQLDNPMDLALDRQNNLYVLDSDNNRVQKFDRIFD